MSDKEAKELVRKMQEHHSDNVVRGLMGACISTEMGIGRSREEAELICYLKIRKKADEGWHPQFETKDAGPDEGGSPSPD
jgi:hypothetical protein